MPRQPAILSEAGAHADLVARPLVDAGFAVQHADLPDLPERLDSGQFNVLLLGRFYNLRKTREQEAEIMAAFAAALDRFLAAGGGVFFAMPSGGVLDYVETLDRYGVRILELAIRQPGHLIDREIEYYSFKSAWTTGIHPDFAGNVGGVWYLPRMGDGLGTRPVWGDPDRGWFPILAGGPDSHTDVHGVGAGNHEVTGSDDQPGYDHDVPIIQGCDLGPGRLAVCGIPSGYCLDIPHNCPAATAIMRDGFDGRPSGLGQLLVNICGWLAAPSLDRLGGAPSDPQALEPQVPRFADDPPVRWANPEFPPADPAPRQGLIGARTELSCGRGTVADYVTAARAAGLDFIVFLEEFASLTPAGLDRLKADCEAASDDAFLAVPGYTIEDVAGSHYFQYGYQIAWPSADIVAPDGKRIGPAETDAGSRNSRLENCHATLMFTDLGARCRRGRFRYGISKIMLEENRFSDSTAVVTWHDGKIVDDIRDQYGMLESLHMRLNPTVLALLDGPGDVTRAVAAGWRNVFTEPYQTMPAEVLRKWMAPELEWWGMIDEARTRTPRFRLDNWQSSAPFQYVTNGPEIRAWTASVTSRDPSWREPDTEIPPTADWFRNDVIHFRLRLAVHSAVGLASVILLDGQRPLRRWLPGGANDFARDLDLAHHQQMHLRLEARDLDGGLALTQDYPTLRLDWCEFYCADRNNPLMLGYEKDAAGNAYGWAGTLYLFYNNGPWGGTSHVNGRLWYYGDALAPVPRSPVHDPTQPTDGGVGNVGGRLNIFPLLPGEETIMVRSRPETISPDVAFCRILMDRVYDPRWHWFFGRLVGGFGLYPSRPSDHLRLERRAWVVRPEPGRLTAMVYEYDIAWNKPPDLTEPFRLGWLSGETDHVLHRHDGSRVALPGRDTEPLTLTWGHGEYIVSRERGTRPAIFYNDGPELELWRDTESDPEALAQTNPLGERLCLRLMPRQVPCRLRFIAAGGSTDVTDPEIGPAFVAATGLDGPPAYDLALSRGGVRDQRLVLALDAVDGGVAFELDPTGMPTAVPIAVHGLNPNWTVLLVDRRGGRWRPLGLAGDVAWATLTTGERWDVFIGHPVVAADPAVVLNVVQVADDRWQLEVHNPGGKPVATVRVEPVIGLGLWAWEGITLDLAAGTSTTITLEARP